MNEEIVPNPNYGPWGPFIADPYQLLHVTRLDIALASTAFALAGVFAISAAYIAVGQSKRSSRPWRSAYLWMVWLEWSASIVIAIECLLFLLRIIRPSFYFYMSIRIWAHINKYWDRTEKVIYLFMDAALNIYFIRVVKGNLVRNGLQKYKRLVQFNERIILVSILMDVMIIAAMDIPNGFVYAIFHPLAYLIKLNIEMSMAHLITRIALGNQTCPLQNHNSALAGRSPISSVTAKPQPGRNTVPRSLFGRENDKSQPHKDVINKRRDFVVQSSSAADPEDVHMEYIHDESPLGSSSSNEAYEAGLRSIAKARSRQQEASASSAKSTELKESWVNKEVTKPEPTWPPTKWSEMQLN